MPDNSGVSGLVLVKRTLAAVRATSDFVFDLETGDKNSTAVLGRYSRNGIDGVLSNRGGQLHVRIVGGFAYLKGTDQVLRTYFGSGASADDAIAQVHGKWAKVSAVRGPGKSLAGAFARKSVLILPSTTRDLAGARTVAGHSIAGRETVGISLPGLGAILYVARTGTPYPVSIADTPSDGAGESFSHWGEPYTVLAPPRSDVDDLSGAF